MQSVTITLDTKRNDVDTFAVDYYNTTTLTKLFESLTTFNDRLILYNRNCLCTDWAAFRCAVKYPCLRTQNS